MPTSGERRTMTESVEKSLARLEKLVENAKRTLSDKHRPDLDQSSNSRVNHEDLFFEKKLKEVESNFKSDANEILLKMDKMLASNNSLFLRKGASEVHNKIKELNEKIENRSKVTGQSRRKLLSLIHEKELKTPSNGSEKRSIEKSLSKEKIVEASKLPVSASTNKTKEDLRDKILQTEEIVDRGFQTARQLAQKVESIAKTEKKEETSVLKGDDCLIDKRKTGSDREKQEVILEVPEKVLVKASRKKQKSERHARKSLVKNCSLVAIQEKECKVSRPVLQFQQLPSLRIRGGLQVQKVHSLEILPEKEKDFVEKTNTGLHIVSHDIISEEKTKTLLKRLLESDGSENASKCPNCGKSVRAPERVVNPKQVDDILLQCNFNVFDSRIEEFAEKYGRGAIQTEDLVLKKPLEEKVCSLDKKEETQLVKKTVEEKKIVPVESRMRINELCRSLSRKYKEKASGLKDDHDALNSIMRDLFQRVDESRKFFGDLRHFSRIDSEVRNLKVTKPIVVSLPGQAEQLELNEIEEDNNELRLREGKKMPKTYNLDQPREIKNKRHSKPELPVDNRRGSVVRRKKVSTKKLVEFSSSSSSTTLLSLISSKENGHSKKYEKSKSDYESDFEGESGETSKGKNKPSPELSERSYSQKGSLGHKDLDRSNEKCVLTNMLVGNLVPGVNSRLDGLHSGSDNASPKMNSSKDDHFSIAESENSKSLQKLNKTTCLKEVLSVLEDRIVRTQSLAEKLITDPNEENRDDANKQENTHKSLETQLPEPVVEKEKNNQESGVLYSSSKSSLLSLKDTATPIEEDITEIGVHHKDSSEGKTSSLGEVHQEDIVRQYRSDSERSGLKIDSRSLSPGQNSLLLFNPREVSHSEGEIMSEVVLDIESSSINSLGEVS